MNNQDKTKEELIAGLLELQRENRELKLSLEKNRALNPSSAKRDETEQTDFRETKEHFELMFDISPDAAIITRLKDGIIIEVNDGFSNLTGYTRKEVLGRSVVDINLWHRAEDRHLFIDELQKNGFCNSLEGAFVRQNGSSLIGLISAKTFMLHGVPHIFSIVRDITDLKLAEKQRMESEANARAIIEATTEPLFLLDKNALLIDTNEAHAKRLGLTREELIGKNVFELLPAAIAERRYGFYKQVLETGKFIHDEDFRNGYWNGISYFPVFNSTLVN